MSASPGNDTGYRHSSPQHRGQLIWTGLVALILGIVALQQAADPGAGTLAQNTPDAVTTGNPLLDSSLSLGRNPLPWDTPSEPLAVSDPALEPAAPAPVPVPAGRASRGIAGKAPSRR